VQTIDKTFSSTTEVKRSKFITHLVPIHLFDGLQAKLKSEHPKANHVVYALRSLNEFDQIVENSSDDGEPKGCAGLPALNVLRGSELINCAVLIVRYFGGIKLGTGGMARAYAQAVKDVIDIAQLQLYEKQIFYSFETDYSNIEKTLYIIRQVGIDDYDRSFEIETVKWKIKGSEVQINQLKEKILQR